MFKIKNKIIKKLVFSLLTGIAVALTVTVLSTINPLHNLNLKFSNSLYKNNNPSSDIIIVAIDDESRKDSESKGGLGKFKEWPVNYYADAIENINKVGGKVIGLDIILDKASTSIKEQSLDKIIVNSMSSENPEKYISDEVQKFSNVLDPKIIHPDDKYLIDKLNEYKNIVLVSQKKENGDIDMPYKLFADAVNGNTGFINFVTDPDNVVRKIRINTDEKNSDAKPFSIKIAENYLGKILDNLPLENNNEFLINFFGPPNSFKRVSFEDVYNDNFNTEIFKDKIVLIGLTSSSVVQDEALTPTSTFSKMPGVEVHANAIQTILDGKFLRNQTLGEQIFVLFLISILLILVLSFINIWFGIALTVLAGILYFVAANMAFQNGIIMNMIYPFIAILIAYLSSIVLKYFTELREKGYIQNAFGKYLSPNVMKTVLDNPTTLHLGGTKKEVTVFFSDIANFTGVSEGMTPEELILQLNEYLSAMTNIVMKNEGTLDKYVGDAIVAYFGAPISQEDHAIKACNTALEMRIALASLHEKWTRENKKLLDFRAGINTGEVIVGNVGSEKRFDYTIIGDNVNLGSRLEGANKKYDTHIMISEDTKAKIGDEFLTRELDVIKVKGKEKPVRVYELLARKGSLSEIGLKLLDAYSSAISLYNKRDFKSAFEAFKQALQVYPEDGPSKLYLQRSEILRDFPPKPDWDGVFTMKEK